MFPAKQCCAVAMEGMGGMRHKPHTLRLAVGPPVWSFGSPKKWGGRSGTRHGQFGTEWGEAGEIELPAVEEWECG